MEIAIDTRLSHVEFQQTSTLLSRLQKQRTKFLKNKEMVVGCGPDGE